MGMFLSILGPIVSGLYRYPHILLDYFMRYSVKVKICLSKWLQIKSLYCAS